MDNIPLPIKDIAVDLGITVGYTLKFHEHICTLKFHQHIANARGIMQNIFKATADCDASFIVPL